MPSLYDLQQEKPKENGAQKWLQMNAYYWLQIP
jgi:hypothetical protein